VIEAVTFDHWNTLVAVAPYDVLRRRRLEAWTAALAGEGHETDPDTLAPGLDQVGSAFYEAWVDNRQFTTAHAIDTLLVEIGVDVEPDGRAAMAERLDGAPMEPAPDPAPGLVECLDALAAADVRIGIICDVGMTPSTALRANLERMELLHRFDHWSFSDEVGVYKPDPRIFEHAMAGLGVSDPARMAHIGDLRRTDIAGALSMGMTAVRFRGVVDDPKTDANAQEGDHVIDSHDEILDALGLT
jgi:putative hydrolase of the HAD superfamily